MSDIWTDSQNLLREYLGEHSYKSWFLQTKFHSYEDGQLKIVVPTRFLADWLRDNFGDKILGVMTKNVPEMRSLMFLPNSAENFPEVKDDSALVNSMWIKSESNKNQSMRTKLNPRYDFDSFVVGPGNRFAHAASMAVAESPSRSYNPLFIYGGTGLGKTHLMQAIGNRIFARNEQVAVTYISSENFTNQLIDGIRKHSTPAFREKYRRTDILLVDDIHFIAGKESTQEEFFHTFNALHDAHKQIVLSSDRPPKEIPTLEERLRSRFEWGLVADIQPPDLETRVAILQKNALRERWQVPVEVCYFIADLIKTNIRELEGSLVKVKAYASLVQEPVSVDLVKEVLKDLVKEQETRQITVDSIQRVVCNFYDLRIADLKSRNKQRAVAFPRQVAMFLCKSLIPTLSLSEVGEAFGGRDHTTVIHACKQVETERQLNQTFAATLEKMVKEVRQ